jgi:signal transduction histidine kinase/FixJ family two-component response regulator
LKQDELKNVMKPTSLDAESIKVLIIEDEEAHFELMQRAICKELPVASVYHTPNAIGCLEELTRINPDVILVDYLMPGMTGIEFLEALKRMDCDIPVIMITGQGDEKIAVQAMKLGAKDYLVKSADFFLLLPVVIGQVVRNQQLKRNLREVARLNELLLDSLPYPAMMIRRDRLVLAANRIAEKMGVRVGEHCWQNFNLGSPSAQWQDGASKCPFCRVNDAFDLDRAINNPVLAVNGHFWDIWWIPIDREVCLTYAIDITERKRAEDALHISSRFLEISNQHSDMRSLLQAFVQELKKVTSCSSVAVWVSTHEAVGPLIVSEGCDLQLLLQAATAQIDRCAAPVKDLAGQESTAALAVAESLPLKGAGAAPVPRFAHIEQDRNKNPVEQPVHLSSVFLPICLDDRILGSIYIADAREGLLSPEIIAIVNDGVIKLAGAVERILSKEQLKKSEQALRFLSDRLMVAHEEERKIISRELHDSIGSSLCAIRLSIVNMMQSELGIESLEKIASMTQVTIDELRRIMNDMRPAILDELGILAALSWFCRQFKELHPDIKLMQRIEIKEDAVPEPLKIIILRIVQESFNNIIKYSQAKTVTLSLLKNGDTIRLCVNDDGIGFDPDKGLCTGIGLMSMKERAELSGGVFYLKSSKGQGTTVTVSWPQG